MSKELLYTIGEILIMELDEIENITYPQNYEHNSFCIITKSGKSYQLNPKRNSITLYLNTIKFILLIKIGLS